MREARQFEDKRFNVAGYSRGKATKMAKRGAMIKLRVGVYMCRQPYTTAAAVCNTHHSFSIIQLVHIIQHTHTCSHFPRKQEGGHTDGIEGQK